MNIYKKQTDNLSQWSDLVGLRRLAFAVLAFVVVTARDQLNNVRNDLDRLAEDEDHRHDDQDYSKLMFLLLLCQVRTLLYFTLLLN